MDIGKILQDARIAKSVSLEIAAQETNIRKVYLEAIEKNEFSSLPGIVFVKGIIRTYGNYLGLDGAQLVEEYKAACAGSCAVKDNNTIRESQHVKVRPTFKSNRDIGSGNGNRHGLLFIFAGLLAVVIAAFGGIYFYLDQKGTDIHSLLPLRLPIVNEAKGQVTKPAQNAKNNTEPEKNFPVPQESKMVPEVKAEETKVKTSQPAEKTVEKPAQVLAGKEAQPKTGETSLKITSTGKCWLRVADQKGVILFEGNLLKGESKNFISNSNIIMRIGNLKDLQIEHNGKALPFESTNEAVTRVYTPKEV